MFHQNFILFNSISIAKNHLFGSHHHLGASQLPAVFAAVQPLPLQALPAEARRVFPVQILVNPLFWRAKRIPVAAVLPVQGAAAQNEVVIVVSVPGGKLNVLFFACRFSPDGVPCRLFSLVRLAIMLKIHIYKGCKCSLITL